ncbi:hypothetical protein ACFLTE_00075 [Bacteroidota bacterium]
MNKITIILASILLLPGCQSKRVNSDLQETKSIYTNSKAEGAELVIQFEKGESHNYPSFSFWIEDLDGNYIETLFVTRSVGTGVFNYGKPEKGKWNPDQKRYPATLPYWSHKRGIISSDGLYVPDSNHKVIDGITGATPQTNFNLHTKLSDRNLREFKLMFEINQTWDFNEYWTNNKYPDNDAYKRSCQPSVIYEVLIDLNDIKPLYEMKAVGHGHYAGETGDLFKDLSTLTTALDIARKIQVQVKN